MGTELRVFSELLLSEHQGVFADLTAAGFQPVHVSGYPAFGTERVASIWEKTAPGLVVPWLVRCGLPGDEHDQLFATLPGQGYRPVTVSGYRTLAGSRFTSLWQSFPGAAAPEVIALRDMTGEEFQARLTALEPQGFVPYDVCGYSDNGPVAFTALWRRLPPADWVTRFGLTTVALADEMTRRDGEGFVLWALSCYEVFGTPFYAAVWARVPVATRVSPDLSTGEFEHDDAFFRQRGYRTARLRGRTSQNDDHRFSAVWTKPSLTDAENVFVESVIKTFMTKYKVPGMQVARTDRGRLSYARSFGVIAPGSAVPVTDTMLFRVASIAKPITSTAVLRLADLHRLSLDDRVLGPGALLGETHGAPPYDAPLLDITVRHLLEHTGGWPTNPDPMFAHYDLDRGRLIDWVLGRRSDGQPNAPLAHRPGTVFEYSNFGYCLLGRVIETVTGLPYDTAVRDLVLLPCGITGMRIAGDTLADRLPEEVVYTETGTAFDPYAMHVSRMDSHGGWLATATDLMRFTARLDGSPYQPDLLSPTSLSTMFTPGAAVQTSGEPSIYAKGWFIHPPTGNRWHRGDFAGTQTIIVSTPGGQSWALLANGRDGSRPGEMFDELDRLMWTITGVVTDWPVVGAFRD
ncbi:serine hydrolase [Herbidospora sp. NBRC 101105]|uniref:serine hydrolase n=1 Tax=Herbidospora sp. NBRC 101105 TaxID=3032195 RepID=UPI002556AA64|nr:serine hydrolase [Herbidospora sp. NBRC 101105]